MRLDFKSLAFGYELQNGGGNPAWETALGQGVGYKLKDTSAIDDLVKGMIYKAVPPKTISFKKGKGGNIVTGDADNSGLVIAAVFDKVFINEHEIQNGKFILLISKDDSQTHSGRLKLKYGVDNTYKVSDDNVIKNRDFIDLVETQIGLAKHACWFVYDISVENQDTLRLRTIIVNKDASMTYVDSKALHSAWEALMNAELPKEQKVATQNGENILLYGVPGCGKSHTIKNEYCNNANFMQRVVFHPDYTYSDFIGQILPVIEKGEDGKEKITYKFMPGPFTTALKNAVNDVNGDMYYLVIEEINRGNAPAIFGEVFQLLDRENGESEYGITNFDIAKEVYGDKNHEVKLPSNLMILATMNTADQNVFTLDTAFKRRWVMRSIENSFENCDFAIKSVCGTNVSWESFVTTINNKIIEFGKDNISTEDARIGTFFVKESELEDKAIFSEKVLMYLWNDAFKYNREKIFKTEYSTLEKLIKGFKENGFDVFVNGLIFETTTVSDAVSAITTGNLEQYLSSKKPELVTLYNQLVKVLDANVTGIEKYVTKSNSYIALKANSRVLAEVDIQKNAIRINTKTPNKAELQIGNQVPDTHGWTLNYTISFADSSMVEAVANAIINSHGLER